jgi:hypothetical protein
MVDVDVSGNVYVTDTYNSRVLEFDTPSSTDVIADRAYGHVAQEYANSRCSDGGVTRFSLCRPHGLEVTADGTVYVVDSDSHRVLVFAAGADVDGDGCSDVEEFGTAPLTGGARDPDNRWDFYDVNGSQKVDAVDINLVRSNFNGTGPTPPEDLIYDRSIGAAPWAPGPPDNKINGVDVNLVRAVFNHSCQPPP